MDKDTALDIGALERSLYGSGEGEPGSLPWLEASWRHPESFWLGLWERARRGSAIQPGSLPFRFYDFYHDIVHRFEGSGRGAMQTPDGREGWRVLSFAGLGQQSRSLASAWLDAGAEKGRVVAFVLDTGETLMRTLLTALRLGMVISLIPPAGRFLLTKRMERLRPDFVVVEDLHAALPVFSTFKRLPHEVFSPEALSRGASSRSPLPSQAVYPSSGTAALLFDPTSPEPCTPRPLTADALYLGALRDGMLVMGLRSGDFFAAPGFHLLETEPSLMLAGLLSGATRIHMEPENMGDQALCLGSQPLRVLGISRVFRDSLSARTLDLSRSCLRWFRHPGEGPPSQAWTDCIQNLGLGKAMVSCHAWNASLGGVSLFSTGKAGRVHAEVFPAAGIRWRLGDVADPSLSVAGQQGLFMPCPDLSAKEGDEAEGALASSAILSPHGKGYFHAPAPHTGKRGLCYPEKEILEILKGYLPKGIYTALAILDREGAQEDPVCVLLVFGPGLFSEKGREDDGQVRLASEIRTCIAREAGEVFVPDQVKFFPLFPRFDETGEVDGRWCADQYLTGRLQRKSRHPVFRSLARLQAFCAQPDGRSVLS
jgi:hypothetical protein